MRDLNRQEIKLYAENLLNTEKIIEAKKVGNTYAVQGIVGETIITWSMDADGNPIVEREQTVTLDENTNEPGWVLTKIDDNNEPVFDKNGHLNQYVVADSKFKEMYEASLDGENLYSKSQIERFLPVYEDLHFQTKYGEMTIMSGGYLKVTNMESISGISGNDFNTTYVVVENQKKL